MTWSHSLWVHPFMVMSTSRKLCYFSSSVDVRRTSRVEHICAGRTKRSRVVSPVDLLVCV